MVSHTPDVGRLRGYEGDSSPTGRLYGRYSCWGALISAIVPNMQDRDLYARSSESNNRGRSSRWTPRWKTTRCRSLWPSARTHRCRALSAASGVLSTQPCSTSRHDAVPDHPRGGDSPHRLSAARDPAGDPAVGRTLGSLHRAVRVSSSGCSTQHQGCRRAARPDLEPDGEHRGACGGPRTRPPGAALVQVSAASAWRRPWIRWSRRGSWHTIPA